MTAKATVGRLGRPWADSGDSGDSGGDGRRQGGQDLGSRGVGEPLVRSVDHVSFVVHDLDAALAFYVDLLGCEPIERPDLGFPGAWLRVGAPGEGGGAVHLLTPIAGVDVGSAPGSPTGAANHVAFSIRDYTGTLARLRAAGLEVGEGHSGITQMFLQDPSGNVIELIERRA